MPSVGWGELVFILLVCLVIFGKDRLPDIGRQFGKAIQEFKKGLKEGGDGDKPGA